MNAKTALIGIILVGLGIATASAAFTVRETEQVLIRQFGEVRRVISEPGLNFKIPMIQTATYFDKRVLDFDAPKQEVPTLDQKQLVVDAFARYRIVDSLDFFKAVNNEVGFEGRLLNVINSALRQVIGGVNLAVVMTGERAEMMATITQLANANTQNFGVEVIDVRIKRVDLPADNSEAIYQRMKTQREQEATGIRAEGDKESRRIRAEADKRQRVIIAEAKKQAEILRGEGDAQAQATYNDAYGRDPEFFDFWRSMQAMQKGLSSDTTTYVGPPDTDFFRYFGREEGVVPSQ